jgi:serine/threonine protein kinase
MSDYFGSDLVLLEKIDTGGMAEVFRARLSSTGGFDKIVAVKRLLPHLTGDTAIRTNFQREISLVAKLQHPNIVQVFYAGQWQNYLYLVMEFVEGKNLNQLMEGTRQRNIFLPVPVVCHIIGNVARGLGYAHTLQDELTGRSLNIIHRDINPRNIMLSYRGEIKLVDFGIAKAVGSPQLTDPGIFKGTLRYASPEQVKDKEIDARTDIFSLGVILYELLTQKYLFEGETAFEVINKIVKSNLTPPSSLRSEIPQALDEIVLKALKRDRGVRYQSAEELYKDLLFFRKRYFPGFIPDHFSSLMKEIFSQEILNEQESRQSVNISSQINSPTENLVLGSDGDFDSSISMKIDTQRKALVSYAVKVFVFFTLGIIIPILLFISVWQKKPTVDIVEKVPSDLPGLVLWLTPDTFSVENNSSVTGWKSLVGTNLKAIQSNPVRQPRFVQKAINGRDAIGFDGKDDFLILDPLNRKLRGLDSCTIIFVVKTEDLIQEQSLFSAHAGNRLSDVFQLRIKQGGLFSIRLSDGKNNAVVAEKASLEKDRSYIVAVVFYNQRVFLFQNGSKKIDRRFDHRVNFSHIRYFSIGQEWDYVPSDFFNGDLSEFIIYDHAMLPSKRSVVEKYLSQKYKIRLN